MRNYYPSSVRTMILLAAATSITVIAPAAPDRTSWSGKIRPPNAAPRYEAVDLGLPEGATGIIAYGASPNFRSVVGYASTRTVIRAFLWHDGKFRYLSPTTTMASAWAVNDAGTVAGELIPDEYTRHAVVWKGGRTTRLFRGTDTSLAQGIDRRGNVFGSWVDPKAGHLWRAYRHRPDGSTTFLETEPDHNSFFHAANEKGLTALTLALKTTRDGRENRVVLWDGKRLQELPSLQAGIPCRALGMNNRGDVVGIYRANMPGCLPVIWRKRQPSLLPIPKDLTGSAVDINERGDVIGDASTNQYEQTPFLIRRGTFYRINDLLGGTTPVLRVQQISDSGTILAAGRIESRAHAFLLRPVP